MKRRLFSTAALNALLVGATTPALAQDPLRKPESGWDYLVLPKQAAVLAPAGRIEVVEFFWYNCPHCAAFEPALQAWMQRLPGDVAVRRVPVGFRDEFVPQQRLYYALSAMGLVEQLHAKVFTAIHKERLDLARGASIVEWMGQQGVDKARFSAVYGSRAVQDAVSAATLLQDAYGVEGVPAMGVAGRFYTDGSIANNMTRALQVVDFLIAEVRSGR